MSALAVSLLHLRAIALCMTFGADRLDMVVVCRAIPKVMIVFVTPLTIFPYMAAIRAWQRIWMWPVSRAYFDVDTLPSLLLVAIARRERCRPWL